MDFMPLKTFRRCVERYRGNFSVKSFTCMDQFHIMAFAQLAYSGHRVTNSTTWASAARFPAAPWRKPTRCGTGASVPILPII
ncbi:MAG: DUF4372 domain-containing protein [Syntrophobacterales bacterium]|nr:DUF4372 domain-containing protein [Syntrophobacterales bacterium]